MTEDKSASLLKWFQIHGGTVYPSISLQYDEEYGYHFRTTDDIPASTNEGYGTQVCRCPLNLTLSYLNILPQVNSHIKNSSKDSVVSSLVDKVSPHVIGYFFLCAQKLKKKESFWCPYIDTLPTENELTTPVWFDESDLKWLLGTSMHSSPSMSTVEHSTPSKSAVEERRKVWHAEYDVAIELLKEQGVDVTDFTWKLFLWAATIFSSRAFSSKIVVPELAGEYSVLCPVIDIFNHRFGAKTVWDISSGGFALSIIEEALAGQQIFNNYAPKGNEELLMGYGFCIPNNPCDQVTIGLGKPPEEVHAALRQAFPLQFSSPEWTAEQSAFFLRGSRHYSGGFQHEISCLRGIPPELFHTICAILSYSNGDMDDEELVDATVGAILDRLRVKRTAIVRWDDELPDVPQNIRQMYAKIYRDGQIEILTEIIGELEGYFE